MHSIAAYQTYHLQPTKCQNCISVMISLRMPLKKLKGIGEQVDHRHFVAFILEKLTQKVHCQLYTQKPEDKEWTTPSLRKLLGYYISAMEMAAGENSERQPTVSNPSRSVLRHRPLQPRPTTEGLLATNSKQNLEQVQIGCVYCSKPHWSDECPNYVTLQAWRERLKGCCFNCLKRVIPLEIAKRIEHVSTAEEEKVITVVFVKSCLRSQINKLMNHKISVILMTQEVS